MKTGEANLPPPLRAYDLEHAARYAERRATELRDEAAIAETYYAKRSIITEAQEHEDRARRYRRAAGRAPKGATRGDTDAAIDTLREYLHTANATDARRVLRELQRLQLELAHTRDLTDAA